VKQIAKNGYYELKYDETENWIYWTMQGFWQDMSVVPNFDKDWDAAQALAKPDFRIFTDLSLLRAMPGDVQAAQDARQQKLMESGCARVSCFVESAFAAISLNSVIKSSGMDKIVQSFYDAAEAREWLKS
jgi:hypothetical protein